MNALFTILPPIFAIAGYTEVKHRRIPNWLTVGGMLCALAGAWLIGGMPLLRQSGMGLLVGGGVFLPFCLAGIMGGGDFKLMAAVGAVVGYPLILTVLYYTCLAGGALALIYIVWSGRFFVTFTNVGRILTGRGRRSGPGLAKVPTLPYGLAIAAGTFWAIMA